MTAPDGGSVQPRLKADELLAAAPDEIAELKFHDFKLVPGCELTFNDYSDLAALVRGAENDGAQGVVIVQGTDTLEETAFALDLLYDGQMPVVLTGAMRNPTQMSPDGPLNLCSAIRVAASTDFRGGGAMVVMAEEIHAARFVRKAHCSRGSAFESVNGGKVGYLSEGHVVQLSQLPALKSKLNRSDAKDLKFPRVALLKIAVGDDGSLIRILPELGFGGLVIEAMGAGHVPVACAHEISAIADLMPVLLTSRTGAGEVFSTTYGFPGSETDLIQRGVITAGWCDGLKTRIALTLLLHNQATRSQIGEFFSIFDGGRVPVRAN